MYERNSICHTADMYTDNTSCCHLAKDIEASAAILSIEHLLSSGGPYVP